MKTLKVPATLESLEKIRDYVQLSALAAQLNPRAIYSLSLAVDEIASNAIVHGHSADLTLQTTINPDKIMILLEDSGIPFDPSLKNSPENLGVYMALESVDEFAYEYLNGKNRHTFAMSL